MSSSKPPLKDVLSGFGWNYMEKGKKKTHILGNFQVMVQVVFCFYVLTNIRIVAITFSVLIRFT